MSRERDTSTPESANGNGDSVNVAQTVSEVGSVTCCLCDAVPQTERGKFRANLNDMPLSGPVCDACEIAFWRGLGLPVAESDDEVDRDIPKPH